MLVDYRYLNKTSPEDDFLLPHVDVLVDNSKFVKLRSPSWMVCQIITKSKWLDKEKTSFIALCGTFYYKVRPFDIEKCMCYLSKSDGSSIPWHDGQRNEGNVDTWLPSLSHKRIIWMIWERYSNGWESMTSNSILAKVCLAQHQANPWDL